MKTEITRDVVSDLWPLYRAGEASRDSKALVDEFLAEDSDFASTLHKSGDLGGAIPPFRLSPEAERRLLDDARGRARNKLMVIGVGIGLAAIIILTALGGALLVGLRTFGQG
jgi:hypothetical protein